jgi:RHS repeat-associated protein
VKTVKSIRSDVPSREWPVYTTESVFDYFGRLRRLTYPDGELLTYTYDQGGLLATAHGVKGNKPYEYLRDLAYDEFGQRRRLQAGNGVETRYSYDPLTRRLASILTIGAAGQVLQNIDYAYDRVGNVLSTENRPFVTRDDTSRSVVQQYAYDDLHRLITASGTYAIGADHIDRHQSAFTYDTIGNFQVKDQRHWYEDPLTGSQSNRPHSTYTFGYQYQGAQPHAVTHVGGKTYSYDQNGNLVLRIDDQTGQTRQILWNEENRITRLLDQGKETIFRYDDAGMRIVKRGKYGEIAYVDPNFSIREGEVASKHIFAGSTRLATKLVMMENRTSASKNTYIRPPDAHGHSDTIPEKSRGNGQEKQLDPELQKQVNGQGWQERERRTAALQGKGHDKLKLDNSQNTTLPGNSEQGLENALAHGNGNKIGITRRLDRLGYEVTADHRIVPKGTDGTDPGDGSEPVFSGPTIPEEHQIFYYHGDHLGSSNVITDRFGRNYEHLEYFPYGEAWVEETRSQTNLPFKFTGKELDPETGLYYFGARYYDPQVSVWVSVDPILEKYLPNIVDNRQLQESWTPENGLTGRGGIFNTKNLNLYGYVQENPMIYIDPDGNRTYLGGAGVSLIGFTGAEGSIGILFNPGLDDGERLDIGIFASMGAGVGVNVSADAFVGTVSGPAENVSGKTVNVNVSAGPISTSTFIDPSSGEVVGGTIGAGPGLPAGVSGTGSATGAVTLRGLVDFIKRTNPPLNANPAMDCHPKSFSSSSMNNAQQLLPSHGNVDNEQRSFIQNLRKNDD